MATASRRSPARSAICIGAHTDDRSANWRKTNQKIPPTIRMDTDDLQHLAAPAGRATRWPGRGVARVDAATGSSVGGVGLRRRHATPAISDRRVACRGSLVAARPLAMIPLLGRAVRGWGGIRQCRDHGVRGSTGCVTGASRHRDAGSWSRSHRARRRRAAGRPRTSRPRPASLDDDVGHHRLVRLPRERAAGRDLRPGAGGGRHRRRAGARHRTPRAGAARPGRGLVEFVPEYAGTALRVPQPRRTASVDRHRPRRTTPCSGAPRPADVVALAPAPGPGHQRHRRHGRAMAEGLVWRRSATSGRWPRSSPSAAHRSARTRPFCLDGLQSTYGLRFDAFLPARRRAAR